MDSAPAPPTLRARVGTAVSALLVSSAKLLLSVADWLLKVLNITPPEANDDRRRDVVKAIRKLWVAGALGAFFTALSRNLPVDLAWPSTPIDWTLTTRQILRYGYLLWLLLYFLVSSVGVERISVRTPKPPAHQVLKDIAFDMVQSFLALLAAYFLRFIQPGSSPGQYDFAYPNFAILVICAVSWLLFPSGRKGGVPDLRIFGGAFAAISLISVVVGRSPIVGSSPLQLHIWLLIFLLPLFLILLMYFRIRLDQDEATPNQEAEAITS